MGSSGLGPPSHRPQVSPNSVRPHTRVSSPTLSLLVFLLFPPQVYEGGSNVDQFVTRFLLKETANQIQSLLSSVESAVEAIEEQTSQIRCVQGASQGHIGARCSQARASLLLGAGGGGVCVPESWWPWQAAALPVPLLVKWETVAHLPPQCL